MEGLREGYEYFTRNSGALLGAGEGAAWVDGIDEAIDSMRASLEAYKGDGRDLNKLGGYIAEEWHKGTFNIDAAIKDSADRASIPSTRDLASVDIHLKSGGDYSLKYYKTPDDSLAQQAMTYGQRAHKSPEAARAIEAGLAKPDDLLYEGQKRLIPSDQLDGAREVATRKVGKEAANRPEQAERYRRTGSELTDKVSNSDGVESQGLSKQRSRDLAADAKAGEIDLEKYGVTKQQLVQIQDVLHKSLKAGMTAAVVAATLAAAPAMIEAIEYLVKTGELDIDRLRTAGSDALSGGARGFFTGASCAAITASAGTGLLGETLQALDPSVVGAMAVVLVSAVGNSAKVVSGRMQPAEMADALIRDSFVAFSAVALGSIVQGLAPQLPVLGYLLGSFVGSTVAGFAYGAGKKATLALCVESGFTLFGLVEQDYELPAAAIREIGADVFEYDAFAFEAFEPDVFTIDEFTPNEVEIDKIGITLLRRGVVSVTKIGYVA